MSARQVGPRGMTAFVPNGGSRRETAIILIGTARDHRLDDTLAVAATQGGFYISDELADVLYNEDAQDIPESVTHNPAEPNKPGDKALSKATNKTSGNRAAKKNSKEE